MRDVGRIIRCGRIGDSPIADAFGTLLLPNFEKIGKLDIIKRIYAQQLRQNRRH